MFDLQFEIDTSAAGGGDAWPGEAELQARLNAGFAEAARIRELLRPALHEARAHAAVGGAPVAPSVGNLAPCTFGPDPHGGVLDDDAQDGDYGLAAFRRAADEISKRQRPTSAEPSGRRNYWELNHPTTPRAPTFLMEDSYWKQRQGARRREIWLRKEEENVKREQEHEPFRALPLPASTTMPRFQVMQAAEAARRSRSVEIGAALRRSRSADAFRRSVPERPTPSTSMVASQPELPPPPFQARPVPWQVAAPLYEQMQIEEHRSRRERVQEAAVKKLRASSLPPRLERLEKLRQQEEERQGIKHSGRTHRPISPGAAGARRTHSIVRLVDATTAEPPGQPPWGVSTPSHPTPGRAAASRTPEKCAPRPLRSATTEVPDFTALHEREKALLERRKLQNRRVTQPEPFPFHAPERKRQPPMPKDPTQDWRWGRAGGGQRPASAGARPRSDAVQGPTATPLSEKRLAGDHTKKTRHQQEVIMKRLDEKRREQQRKAEEMKRMQAPPAELTLRVQQAVAAQGPTEKPEDKIARLVNDKVASRQRTTRQQLQELQRIEERVGRRPLLMEQADTMTRARRRALCKVRNALESAGVKDVDTFFEDQQLDELEKAAKQADELASSEGF